MINLFESRLFCWLPASSKWRLTHLDFTNHILLNSQYGTHRPTTTVAARAKSGWLPLWIICPTRYRDFIIYLIVPSHTISCHSMPLTGLSGNLYLTTSMFYSMQFLFFLFCALLSKLILRTFWYYHYHHILSYHLIHTYFPLAGYLSEVWFTAQIDTATAFWCSSGHKQWKKICTKVQSFWSSKIVTLLL